jgi:hypothetical protein
VVYGTGDVFEGTFNDERQKHGHGKYTWNKEAGEDGPKNAWVPPPPEEGEAPAIPESRVIAFEGEYRSGVPHGIGKMTYPNGDVYHGSWVGGKPHGDGTYYYASGDLYSGQWKEGKKHGRGAFVFKADESQLVSVCSWRAMVCRFMSVGAGGCLGGGCLDDGQVGVG